MEQQDVGYRAHTNIALIKYWGKRNHTLFLPKTSSLSLTLAQFYTDTYLAWETEQQDDVFVLNNISQDDDAIVPLSRFVDLFRDLTGIYKPVKVVSDNKVPTAAGLASSASAYAALACVCNDLFQTNLSARELSTYARQGSGSATRSLFGGFTMWHKGEGDNSQSSYAEMIDDASWDIGMITIIVNDQTKKISSREGMEHTIQTSPFYQLWPQTVEEDLEAILRAIEARDFTQMGQIAEHNAMKMHATIHSAKPSFTYWEPESLIAMDAVRSMRANGLESYFTMDAGPNVKILCRYSEADRVINYLKQFFSEDRLIASEPGPAPQRLS